MWCVGAGIKGIAGIGHIQGIQNMTNQQIVELTVFFQALVISEGTMNEQLLQKQCGSHHKLEDFDKRANINEDNLIKALTFLTRYSTSLNNSKVGNSLVRF